MSTLDQARTAKQEITPHLKKMKEFSGIGITSLDGSYAVKVNLISETHTFIPKEVLGVKVVIEITGAVTAY